MKKCVFCGKEFEELSEEHIIPNVICGRIKSKNLLCTDCNSWLGENIDIGLEGKYSLITHLFKIQRERGEGRPIIGKEVENNTEYRLLNNGNYELANVESQIEQYEGGFKLIIESPNNKKQLKNEIGKELASKKEDIAKLGLDYKKAIKDTQKKIDEEWKTILSKTKSFKPNAIEFSCCLGGKEVALAVLKIAFLFFKEIKPQIKIDDNEIIQILKDMSDEVYNRCFFYSLERPLFEESPNEISHFICVKGFGGKIIAYIKLFSITPHVCVLNDNYIGEDFEIPYGYSFLNKNVFIPQCYPIENLTNLKELLEYKKNFDITRKNLKKDLSRIMDLYYKINPKAKKSDIRIRVEKHLNSLLGQDIINTPYFQDLIGILDEKPYYFTNKLSDSEKDKVIHNISMILLEDAIKDLKNSF